jgi:hypothetical protein
MKRYLGTALSVVGLLVVGTAAAAVNVRMLHNASGDSAQFQMRNTSEVAPLGPDPSDTLGAPDSKTGTLPPIGTLPGGVDGDGDHRGPANDPNRPRPTAKQMLLLRVSAMVRMDPKTVQSIARGDITDATKVSAVQQAADVVGTTLQALAEVVAPPFHDRGHGGPGDGRHGGPFAFDSSTATANYDD